MLIKSATFITSAVKPSQYPPAVLPEIAFSGRSNVGKSSLINCLFNRKRLAKVSGTPGKTRLVNFFSVDERFYLVDLPGYGYARRSHRERDSWRAMVETYLSSRQRLLAMLVLVDIRRGPEDEERMLLETLEESGVRAIFVLIKSDKLAKSRRKLRYMELKKAFGPNVATTVLFSSKTGQGRQELWGEVIRCVNAA